MLSRQTGVALGIQQEDRVGLFPKLAGLSGQHTRPHVTCPWAELPSLTRRLGQAHRGLQQGSESGEDQGKETVAQLIEEPQAAGTFSPQTRLLPGAHFSISHNRTHCMFEPTL